MSSIGTALDYPVLKAPDPSFAQSTSQTQPLANLASRLEHKL